MAGGQRGSDAAEQKDRLEMLFTHLPTTLAASAAEVPETIGFVTLLFIALGLAADCFAVSMGASMSTTGHSRWRVLRTALSFGAFQTLMPIIGWLAGLTVVNVIGGYDHWVAFGLLSFVGGKMIRESFHSEEEAGKGDATRGFMLITLSVATSIDALAVGLSLAFVQVSIVPASLTIGIVAFLITVLGFLVGRRAGELLGKRAETVGGLVLIGIGLRILLSHVL